MVAENPYQSPVDEPDLRPAVGVRSGRWKDLRRVAFAQKGLPIWIGMYSEWILLKLATLPHWGWLDRRQEMYFELGSGILVSFTTFAAMVCGYYIGRLVYGWPKGLALALVTGIPLLTLVGLVVIHFKATRVLRQNGIRVGYFGARLADLDTYSANDLRPSPNPTR